MTIARVFLCTALLVFLLGVAGLPVFGKDGSSDSAKELERIQREMQEKRKDIRRANQKERSVLSDLERIDRDIQSGSSELVGQQKQLIETEASLRLIEANSARLSKDLGGLKTLYGQRIRALYKMHRSSGTDMVSAMDGLEGIARHIKYLGLIAERDSRIIDEYGNALGRMTEQQKQIALKKAEIIESRRAVAAKKAELETKRRRKAAILANVRQEKGLYAQTLHELEEASVSLWAMVRKDEEERRSTKHAAVPATVHGEAGSLPWPLEGPLLTRFGMQRHPQFGTMVFRRGIEISAHEGQPVYAVESGEVAYADWYKGYGKLVILDHGDGFYTLYGNLFKLDRAKGDHVARGQELGLAGETGSLKGSKLYFEVRWNGEAQDPLHWLVKR
ncbi:MAG TPA: peptidoglycan DD-metalloendopeptidase family protein [Nitrospirota bacterium]|nr:peptidoglycan DD-metalloendopeptidase family protein [Nitrospirota bacterium]